MKSLKFGLRRALRLLTALGCLIAATACGDAPAGRYVTVDGAMLGTTFHVVADLRSASPAGFYAAAMALDAEMKASMSIFDATSLLSRINRNETDSTDCHIRANIRLAEEYCRLSGGRYDITVKPLVEAWGFAGRAGDEAPAVDSLLAFVGCDLLRLEEERIVKADPRLQLDLNSIAKGYTVDLLAGLAERFGAENYIVEVGGECRSRGVNRSGGPWRIGIDSPFDGNMSPGENLQVRIALNDGALATSGNYRRFHIGADGRKVAHTIDPRTGRSAVSDLLSVTVVDDVCARADAMATMFLVMGDDARALADAMPDVKVYFIYASGDGFRVWASPGMERLILKN